MSNKNLSDSTWNNSPKAAFFTLGCKLNFAETSMLSRKFIEKGFKKVPFNSQADVYVINTCSVTQMADKKCRNAIKKVTGKGGKVVVVGCYSQLNPVEIAEIDGVDLVLGTKDKFKVLNYLTQDNILSQINQVSKIHSCDISEVKEFEPSYSIDDRTRAFLKVQDGCNYQCSYCTIPLARGESRNEPIYNNIENARLLASKGVKEIVLTGVNIGDFGNSTNETFLDLIIAFDQIQEVNRYRISSIEPNLLTDQIIEFTLNSNRFAPHFHIPLQSGSNKILKLMRRRYNKELYQKRVEKIKELIPRACIGCDVIVGFPGESVDDFEETYQFIQSIEVSYLHVFPYSERSNTQAPFLDNKVNHQIKEERVARLIQLSENKKKKFIEQSIGFRENVIFESKQYQGLMQGYTSNYIRVQADFNKELIGKSVKVYLSTILDNGNVKAEIIK